MFRGSITALVTPFRDGQLDEAALRKMVRFQIEQGSHGLVPVGTTGESPTLSEEEHKRVIEITVEECAGQIPVIAGAGSNNPIEAIKYSLHAQQAGADATLHVAGYYNRPNQEGLYQHFKMVHDATELPIILYNIPPRTIVGLDVDTMARLAELPRVVGVKDATGDVTRILTERQRITKPFSYLSGDDIASVAYSVGGGHGCISVTSNVAPALVSQLHELCLNGDYAAAKALQDRLVPLHKALFLEPNPAGAKYAASLLGLCSEECRLPVVALSDASKAAIRSAMEALELI
ncbi:4-hydroxy-tetrahydrodipicolinate synthase [Pokkaliibacter sp. MBI-7]|uniref:4-hydroxy-tetrahydrodipicolinate synthase n=1 Tax=Proteobacteria bacterium 228 TaxID=2083153 RepID=A0A2S5KQJ8_9PROT|nr:MULTISPECIES: 4-hydroxy-tetrahydrodipicolinate synthase [Pokkaliibacter]MDH2435802.1 4-hydroxy-tetrahydrodipicolinate synthase [Pokkaliibacter sp. MBI-7]PPC77124.1 4-hydroxy-tetrahydrodipicolinate synthase [Pokkaliibacter plantistimulans]